MDGILLCGNYSSTSHINRITAYLAIVLENIAAVGSTLCIKIQDDECIKSTSRSVSAAAALGSPSRFYRRR